MWQATFDVVLSEGAGATDSLPFCDKLEGQGKCANPQRVSVSVWCRLVRRTAALRLQSHRVYSLLMKSPFVASNLQRGFVPFLHECRRHQERCVRVCVRVYVCRCSNSLYSLLLSFSLFCPSVKYLSACLFCSWSTLPPTACLLNSAGIRINSIRIAKRVAL